MMSVPYKVVAVHGNKGGVGKSMVAANIALELHHRGLDVGLLDADLDSPYLAEIMDLGEKVDLDDHRKMVPASYNGMPMMSFAAWVPSKMEGASMKGQMHERWVTDALKNTDWGDIEILVADLPAGTGDEYLTLTKVAGEALLGIVAVAIPNVVSGLGRVYHSASVHQVRMLGVVENMAGEAFGEGNVEAFCEERGLEFFGSIPLDARIRKRQEKGNPLVPEDCFKPIENAALSIVHELEATR